MNRRSIGILIVVGVLVASLGAPAAAKKGGHPGSPSGTGLEVTVEPSGGYMWANSVGDEILFDITVTNSSGGPLEGVAVYFSGTLLATFNLARNASWSTQHTYTVLGGDLAGTPNNTQSSVTVGTVTASVGTVTDSDDAVMTAYPVPSCGQSSSGAAFTFAPTDDYSVCSFSGTGSWTLVTTLSKPVRGKNVSGATVRDGVPGNWCMVGEGVADGYTVTQQVLLPDDGICLQGGAGGDTIPVRNTETFYLATWVGSEVVASPPPTTTPSS